MTKNLYFLITATIFGLIAVLHLLRVLNGWPVQLGPWAFPYALSWGGFLVGSALCVWGFALSRGWGKAPGPGGGRASGAGSA